MIKYLLIVCTFATFISCKKASDTTPTLSITKAQWITSTQNRFGYVSLILSGSTNADYVSVATYGDGVYNLYKLPIDANKNFTNDTVYISFTASANPLYTFSTSTTVSAVIGNRTLTDTLKSGLLHY